MATKIVQLEDDKQNSLLYYPVTLGNAVFYNNTALINTTSGKIPTQFLPSYVDDVLEGLYWDTTEFLKVDDDHILARRVSAGSWTDLDGNTITLDTSKYYIDYNEWNAASPDQDLIVYTGSDVAVAHTDWSTDGLLYTGEAGIIYVSVDTNYQYRWTGSQYIQMTSGNFATAARFGATTTPSEYYGLGGDTVLDLPGISLNGGNLYAPVSSIAWWAPTTAGAGSGTLETGNVLLSNGATPSAPTWLANPSVSGVTRLMLGTTSGAAWDSTSLPISSSNASSLMTLSATGAGWMAGPGAGGKILLSYDDGTSPDHDYKLTWTSLSGTGNIETALATLEVTSAQRGLAPSIPIDTSSNIAPINTDLFIVHVVRIAVLPVHLLICADTDVADFSGGQAGEGGGDGFRAGDLFGLFPGREFAVGGVFDLVAVSVGVLFPFDGQFFRGCACEGAQGDGCGPDFDGDGF